MSNRYSWLLMIGLTALLLACAANAENDFNVVAYGAAPPTISNLDAFFVTLDSFGVSIYSSTSEEAAAAISNHNLGFKLVAAHFRHNEALFLSADNSIQLNLNKNVPFPTYTRMSGDHDDAQWGYSRSGLVDDSARGVALWDFDMTYPRPVMMALVG